MIWRVSWLYLTVTIYNFTSPSPFTLFPDRFLFSRYLSGKLVGLPDRVGLLPDIFPFSGYLSGSRSETGSLSGRPSPCTFHTISIFLLPLLPPIFSIPGRHRPFLVLPNHFSFSRYQSWSWLETWAVVRPTIGTILSQGSKQFRSPSKERVARFPLSFSSCFLYAKVC